MRAVAGAIAAVALTGSTIALPGTGPGMSSRADAARPNGSGRDRAFVVRRVLDLKAPLHHGEFVWDAEGAPNGPVVITADLEAETLSVFRAGYEIGVAAILYGAPNHPTPLGTFRVLQKRAVHTSSIYHAPMPYMLRLTTGGVAIHGSNVVWGYASHGCIGVPTGFARLLFAQAKLGDPVVITRGKTLAVPAEARVAAGGAGAP